MEHSKSLFILFLLLTACRPNRQGHPGTDRNPAVISIGNVRGMPIGSSVTVQGTVTVASGVFASSSPYGYAIQDSTSGIYIIDSIIPVEDGPQIGELLQVSGISLKTNGMLAIKSMLATKKGYGASITPRMLKTGDINESAEGFLIQTIGILDSIKNDLPYGHKLFISDGTGRLTVFVNTSTGLLGGVSPWKVSDSLSVTGFLAQYDGTFEIEPRAHGDIQVLYRN